MARPSFKSAALEAAWSRPSAWPCLREVWPDDDLWSFLVGNGIELHGDMRAFAHWPDGSGFVDAHEAAAVFQWVATEQVKADAYTWASSGRMVNVVWQFFPEYRADAARFAARWLRVQH